MYVSNWVRLIRFGFRLLYNEMAWTYDLVSWLVSLGEWRIWQKTALSFVIGEMVLEVGHGPGHMLLALQQAGYQVMGADLSPYMGRLAKRRTKNGVPLVQAKVQDLPWKTAVFDTVLSTFPTEYIVDPMSLATIYRILKENGRLIIVPSGELTGDSFIHRFIDWLFRITGQRSEPFAAHDDNPQTLEEQWHPFLRPFANTPFQTELKQIQLERSRVIIIIAHKPPTTPQ